MIKYHKIVSVIISVCFLILLQEFSVPRPIFRFLVPAFLVFISCVTLYHRWYLHQINKYNAWSVLRPVLFFGSAFAVFHLVPGDFLRGVFLLLTVALSALFEIFIGDFAENLALNETLIIAFGVYMAVSAAALVYAPDYQTWYLIAIFLATLLVTRSFYEFIPLSGSSKLITSLCLSLFCAEIFWSLTFLPFHYSALGLMLFNIFYFCLILNYYHAFNTLSGRKFQFHLVLMILCNALVFLFTPWKIIP